MSCNITVSVSDDFAKEAKRLAKKYPSFKQDYKEFLESIKKNPLQGDEITKNIRKIRMAIKAKGKGHYFQYPYRYRKWSCGFSSSL